MVRKRLNDGYYSTGEAAKFAGFSETLLYHWLDRAIVTCEKEARGSGFLRRWTLQDVTILRVAHNLKDIQMALPIIKTICEGLRRREPDDMEPIILTSEGIQISISLQIARRTVLTNIKRAKEIAESRPPYLRDCPICGETFTEDQRHVTAKYCSTECGQVQATRQYRLKQSRKKGTKRPSMERKT